MQMKRNAYVYSWDISNNGTFDPEAIGITNELPEDVGGSRVYVGAATVEITPVSREEFINGNIARLEQAKEKAREEFLSQLEHLDNRIATLQCLTHQPE